MGKTNPKVSVIVPVYKAEKYIEHCCRSLFEQSLDDMEFIFVDDCSPDDSVKIIKQIVASYPNRQEQVKILSHSPNRGVSFTRQRGMESAQGEYIIHCDSDDWVDSTMYETMYSVAKEEQADVVCCGIMIESSSGKKTVTTYPYKVESKDLIFNINPLTGSLCNKIVRLSLLREAKVQFPLDINWGEDFCVSIAGLVLSQKTILLPDVFYHYCQNGESITHTISESRCNELIACSPIIESFLIEQNLYGDYCFQMNYLKFQLKQFLLIYPAFRSIKRWASIYPECHKYIMKYNSPLYLRIASYCIAHNCSTVAQLLLSFRDFLSKVKAL